MPKINENEFVSMTFEDWKKTYRPIKNHLRESAPYDGCMFETFGEEKDYIFKVACGPRYDTRRVWTLFDDDTIANGYWRINRLGYFVTEVPFQGKEAQVKKLMKGE